MKNSLFLFIIFFIVSLFISLGTNSLEAAYENNLQMNMLLSNKAVSFQIDNAEKISDKDFFDIISRQKNIFIEKESIIMGIFTGKALYFNNDINMKIPLSYGRFFVKEDFEKNKKIVVIGKNLSNQIFENNSNKYIRYNEQDYLVIGVLGYKDKSSIFDDLFYVNLDSILSKNQDLKFLNNYWILDNKSFDVNETFKDLNKALQTKYNDVTLKQTYEETSKSYFEEILENRLTTIIIIVVVVLVLLLNVVNTTLFYIASKRKEIGVRKAFGATNFNIAFNIIRDYEAIAILAFVVAFIVYILLIKFKFSPVVFGDSIYYLSTILGFLIILFLGILTSLIPVIKSFKLEANEIMRGR